MSLVEPETAALEPREVPVEPRAAPLQCIGARPVEHVAVPEEPVVAPVDLGSSPVLQRLKRSFLSPGALIGLVLGRFSYTSEKENFGLQEQN